MFPEYKIVELCIFKMQEKNKPFLNQEHDLGQTFIPHKFPVYAAIMKSGNKPTS